MEKQRIAQCLRTIISVLCIPLANLDTVSQALAAPPVRGISCDVAEGGVQHIHTHLAMFKHGVSVPVPDLIGISEDGCTYWLHTHLTDGVIHIEAPTHRQFTLGDFFAVWHQPLSHRRAAFLAEPGRYLGVMVDRKPWIREPSLIPLKDGERITISLGQGSEAVASEPLRDSVPRLGQPQYDYVLSQGGRIIGRSEVTVKRQGARITLLETQVASLSTPILNTSVFSKNGDLIVMRRRVFRGGTPTYSTIRGASGNLSKTFGTIILDGTVMSGLLDAPRLWECSKRSLFTIAAAETGSRQTALLARSAELRSLSQSTNLREVTFAGPILAEIWYHPHNFLVEKIDVPDQGLVVYLNHSRLGSAL